MTSPASEAASTPRRVILWAEQPTTALLALGAAFDDLVVGRLDDVQTDLARASADTTLLLAGPIPEQTVDAVVGHVVTVPGSRLALSVTTEPGAVSPQQLEGLRVLGDGRLGDLPVTWWAASDAPADLGPLVSAGAGGPAATTEASFVASAQLLRARRDLIGSGTVRDIRRSAILPDADDVPPGPGLPPGPAKPGQQVAPVTRPVVRGRAELAHRGLLALLLLSAGVLLGILVAQVAGGDTGAWSALLVAVAVIALALAWVMRVLRGAAAQLRDLRSRTQRLEGKVDRGLARVGKRVDAGAERTSKSMARIRQLESRLAVLSTANSSLERSRYRPVRDDEKPTEG